MDTFLLITSGLVFTFMILTIVLKYKIQKSISDSYYSLSKKEKIAFTLAIWGFSIPLVIVANSVLFLIAGGLLCLVGASANFKLNKRENNTHMTGAIGGILLAFVSLVVDFDLFPIFVVFAMISTFLYLMKDVVKYIWWIEILAYYLILIGLIIK